MAGTRTGGHSPLSLVHAWVAPAFTGWDSRPDNCEGEDTTLRGTLLGGGSVHAGTIVGDTTYVSMDRGLVRVRAGKAALLHTWDSDGEVDVALAAMTWTGHSPSGPLPLSLQPY